MNTTGHAQFDYKRSAIVNCLRDQVVADMADLIAQVDALQVTDPLGYTGYFWVRSADGENVWVSGHGWQMHNLVGAKVLKTDGTDWGTVGEVTGQTWSGLTISGLTLATGERIRVETVLPATNFFQVDLDLIDYGDTYL